MATILWNKDRDAPALDAFEELRRRYPRHPRVPEAIYAIGRIHQQAGRSAAAIATYDELAQRDPSNKLATEARWRIGWIHYGQRNWTTAADAFARVGARDDGAYWQARALEHDGQPPPPAPSTTTSSDAIRPGTTPCGRRSGSTPARRHRSS